MKVLIINNVASVGWNQRKGLIARGHEVDLLTKEYSINTGTTIKTLSSYDIVHYNIPGSVRFAPQLFYYWLMGAKVVLHYHGTEARNPKQRAILKKLMRMISSYSIVSTPDLLKLVPGSVWLRNCIDTDVFKPEGKGEGTVYFNNAKKKGIRHIEMAKFINQYERAEVLPGTKSGMLDPRLMSVTALECLSCGLKVKHFEKFDREWVIKYYSIPVYTKQLEKIYKEILE